MDKYEYCDLINDDFGCINVVKFFFIEGCINVVIINMANEY